MSVENNLNIQKNCYQLAQFAFILQFDINGRNDYSATAVKAHNVHNLVSINYSMKLSP